MMVYKYSLHDPDSGKVLYEGTAADLAAQGVVRAEKILPTLWRDQQRQHKRRGKHRWDITREKVEVACSRKAYKVRLKPKKTAAVAICAVRTMIPSQRMVPEGRSLNSLVLALALSMKAFLTVRPIGRNCVGSG